MSYFICIQSMPFCVSFIAATRDSCAFLAFPVLARPVV